MKNALAQSNHFQQTVPLPTDALCLLAIQPSPPLPVEPSISGCGGENDIFCFSSDWGQGTVEQLLRGKVTRGNANTLTYADGDNSVTVLGISNVTLKFGSGTTDSDAARYKVLQSCGAFAAASGEKIFGIVTDASDSGMESPTGEGGENPDPLA